MAFLATYENLLMSSFLLFVNNRILTKASGFSTVTGQVYRMPQTHSGIVTYCNPYGQYISDVSVVGAVVPTGCFVNGNWSLKGQNNLYDFNYDKGTVFFTGLNSNPVITMQYSVKDFSISMPNLSDISVLFESKLSLRPKYGQTLTGIANDELNFPAVFFKNFGGENIPYALGGQKDTKTNIGAYVFADSLYNLDAICSVFKDSLHEYVPLLSANELPYNNLGGMKNNVNFNYTGVTANKVANGSGILIEEVTTTDFSRRGLLNEVKALSSDVFFAVVDFRLSKPRVT